jgi:hypothetical protein
MPKQPSTQETASSQSSDEGDSTKFTGSIPEAFNLLSDCLSRLRSKFRDEPTFAELVFAKYKDVQGQPPDGSRCDDRTPGGSLRFIQFLQSYKESEDELRKQAKLDKKSVEDKIIGLEDQDDKLRLYNAFVLVAEPEQEWDLRLHMDSRRSKRATILARSCHDRVTISNSPCCAKRYVRKQGV